MRYYKGHTFLCQSYFFLLYFCLLIKSIIFFSNHTFHMGSLVSQSTAVLVLQPSSCRGGRDTDASLKRKDNYFNE